jgi:hypothetical protein
VINRDEHIIKYAFNYEIDGFFEKTKAKDFQISKME